MSDRPVLLITGGSRGIGAALAVKAAKAGYDIVINYASNGDAARKVVDACEAAGARAIMVQGDAATQDGVDAVFNACDQTFGRLDAMVPNAGITGKSSTLVDADPEQMKRVIDLNVTGTILATKAALARMLISRGGRGGSIVMLSSAAVWVGGPKEFTWYAASKGAIDSLMIGVAREVADDGVRVNAVAPGLIDTEIHASAGIPDRIARLGGSVPIGRAGTADEVADPILYLMSPQASYVTGTIIKVTGGR